MTRDLRRYNRNTYIGLVVGGLVLLFVVGGGLIYIFYGRAAAVSGLLCMGLGLIPITLIALILWFFDWVVRRANPQ